jgi:4-hydroxy-3-methylbut-2-enyl diphosphate reductase IspH
MSGSARNPAGARTVLLASPRSFCAGVERAIAVVEQLLDQRGGPIYVRKQIVHNVHVVADLQARGAVFVDELDAVPDGATVVFSAHGVSPAVRTVAADRGLEVIDATCPLVTKVHAEARRFGARGDTVILIGHAGHEEDALTAIAAESDLVLVVGSANSSNSVRLVELARRHDIPSYLIDDPSDIRPQWLDGVGVVGLTAGASAPPRLVDAVIAALAQLGPVTVVERETTRETVHFTLPAAVRRS